MSLLVVVLLSAVCLSIAYWTYGPVLVRLLRLDRNATTPAVELRDDVDYSPLEPNALLSQHFSAIAAAGPIVGPILAGAMFGWLPALLWILVGSIFIGGVHDFTALVASIRHKARSIAEVVRDHMTQRSYILFLMFVWLALVYIIVAFTDVTASSFVGAFQLEDGATTVTGGGIASSSLLYLALPIVMGLLLRYTSLSLGWATLIFLPLVAAAIWIGQSVPLDVEGFVRNRDASLSTAEKDLLSRMSPAETEFLTKIKHADVSRLSQPSPELAASLAKLSQSQAENLRSLSVDEAEHLAVSLKKSREKAHKFWDVALLLYCFVASIVPLWLLLQPRGHLGGYFLYAALVGGALGLMFGGQPIQYDAFVGWTSQRGETLFPILFITIACGACSGFHSIIASGTTSKQLRRETDARVIGYGAMLLEGMVAVVSLSCVMILAPGADLLKSSPNFIYAHGIGSYLEVFGIPAALAVSFALMAFTTFVYDTLDVCTRLGRYILQELTGLRDWRGRWLATGITAGAPLYFVMQPTFDPASGDMKQPVWQTFWSLFGASNQLLAALTLLGVTVWLWRTRRARWVWLVTGVPMVWMYVMSSWALFRFVLKPLEPWMSGEVRFNELVSTGALANPVPWVAAVLIGLALLMLVEAVIVIAGPGRGGLPPEQTAPAAA